MSKKRKGPIPHAPRHFETTEGHPDEAPIVFRPIGPDGNLGAECGLHRGELFVFLVDVFGDAITPALKEKIVQTADQVQEGEGRMLYVADHPEPLFPLRAVLPHVDPEMRKRLEEFRAATLRWLKNQNAH